MIKITASIFKEDNFKNCVSKIDNNTFIAMRYSNPLEAKLSPIPVKVVNLLRSKQIKNKTYS